MMKIVLINHTFQIDYFYKRWKLLAEQHTNLDVTLLAPKEWTWGKDKTVTFGSQIEREGKNIDEGNFHIRTIDIVHHKYKSWTSNLLEKELIEIDPDIIYHIGTHLQESLKQCIKIAEKHLPKAKVIAFSMRGPAFNLKIKNTKCSLVRWLARRGDFLYKKNTLKYVYKSVAAIFCHYPDAVSCFRAEGYQGPLYMQTQVGVDTDVFMPNEESRKKIREKYNIGDAYLFGSATRFTPDKGLADIIRALPKAGNWKYLMMGSGHESENNAIKSLIAECGLEDKIILPGFIDWHDMRDYWNALDCAVHTPRTTPTWEETFSLSVVQAMATGLPVIGNTSGSVPYEIGPEGIILEEGNVEQLHNTFVRLIENPEEGKHVGRKMYERATKCFSIQHLDDCFYDTIVDIYNGKHDPAKEDMTSYKVR